MKLVSLSLVALASTAAVVSLGCNLKGDDKASSATVNSGAPGAPAPKGGSCKQTKQALCTEFEANPFGASEGLCTSLLEGTYSKDACARDNLLGTCKSKGSATYYYFGNTSGPWVKDAQDDCTTIHEGAFTEIAGAAETAKQKALPAPERIVASCAKKDGSCEDIFGGGLALSMSKDMCEPEGTWSDGKACPAENIAASCLSKGKVTRYPVGFGKKGVISLKDAATFCKSEGLAFTHWYPNPSAAAPAKGTPGNKPASAAKAKK